MSMESAEWRPYRQHLIIVKKAGLFGGRRYEVWYRGGRVGRFRSTVQAELHIGARIGEAGSQGLAGL